MASAIAGPSHSPGVGAPQFRQFNFFDLEDVKDADDLSSNPKTFKSLTPPILVQPSSLDSPLPPCIIVASAQSILLLDRHFNPLASWIAWEGNGRATHFLEAGGLLVALGEEDGSRYPVLKVWDLTREEKKRRGGGPVLLRNAKIQHGQRPHPISAVALTSNLSHLAIGLGDGTVLLYRHLLQSLTASPTNLTALPKARVIHESQEPVTGLGFREPGHAASSSSAKTPETTSTAQPSLFIVTFNRVLTASVSTRGGDARTIDDTGCGLGCAVMSWDRKELIVARDEALYLYSSEGRGTCYAYEGPKSSITVYKHNLIITSPPFMPSATSNSATVRQYVSKNGDSGKDIAKLTVFDLRNKFISYSGTFREGVRQVFAQWLGVFALGNDGKLSRLDEYSTQAKLEILYKRNMYVLAIELAAASGVTGAGIADIHKTYGDYLYEKGDFDGAMSQFVKTLGHVPPSYVIRKFLDAQRITNLTTYLQALHSANLANPDHTTLLLNCFTKSADRNALDSFIKTETRRADEAGGGLDDLPFDLDTAIRVCRQAGFFEHATYMARKYGRHEDFLRVQIEDAQQYGDALKYLRGLGPEACEANMVLYGRTLLKNVPDETTELLIDLCSGTLGKLNRTTPVDENKTSGSGGPAVLSYLGYNIVAGMFTSEPTTPSPTDTTTANRPQVNGVAGKGSNIKDAPVDRIEDPKDLPQDIPSYVPPSPRRYHAQFIDRPTLFIHFLESVALTLWGQQVTLSDPPSASQTASKQDRSALDDQRSVWNTLLELYLASMKQMDVTVSSLAKSKVDKLLSSQLPFDRMHALLLCSTSGYTQGLVTSWESMGMFEDVLRYYMSVQPSDEVPQPSKEVIRYLDIYGPEHPHLYPVVLRYLTSSLEFLEQQSGQLAKILDTIHVERIMPPLAVVQLLSRNGIASVGNVKQWLRERVEETRQDIESDKSLVQSYRTETETKSVQITSLANPNQPEIFQVTRCSSCNQQLDLPSVHFMCKHSYHQRCLSDSDPECILCARQHAIIKEVRRNQTRLADRHDLFIGEVEEADDGFSVVAGGFGRGLLNLRI